MLSDSSGTISLAYVAQDLWAANSAAGATVAFVQNTSYNASLTVLIDNGVNPPVPINLGPGDSIDHTVFGLDSKVCLQGNTAGMTFTAFRR